MNNIIHDGFYLYPDIRCKLEKIENPLYEMDLDFFDINNDSPYFNADIFRQGACDVFAKVLNDRFGYTIFHKENVHYFCVKNNKYIDVRGWTTDFEEFITSLDGKYQKIR